VNWPSRVTLARDMTSSSEAVGRVDMTSSNEAVGTA
jgi:hypothetical protein